jgi:hypothetical protein
VVWPALRSWALQFLGHFAFEGRSPSLFDNLFQAFFLAPLFVLLEMMFLVGYRPGQHPMGGRRSAQRRALKKCARVWMLVSVVYPALAKAIYSNAERDIKAWKAKANKTK